MRVRFPSSEIATLAALYVAAARWSHGGAIRPGAALGMVLLLVVAWAIRGALRHDGPTLVGEMLLFGASASAIGFATLVSESALSLAMQWTRAIGFGLGAGAAMFTAVRVGRDERASAGSWLAAAIGLVLGIVAFGPTPVHVPAAAFGLGALFPVIAFVFAVRYELTPAPRTRARFVIPGALAGVASGVLFVASLARGARPDASLVLAAAACALATIGFAFGVRGGADAWRRPIVQGAGALVAGGCAATVAAALADDVALAAASGVIAGAARSIAAGAGKLRVDRGRLLDACRLASDRVTGAERLEDLAAAVLEPLRLATRDLQAPAELWVLPFEARFVLDVSGAALRNRLSHAAERAVLSWLRARSSDVLFTDVLRPLEVRRAEVRPVLASLVERDAFAAVPLVEGDELLGVVILPRGRRDAFPTLDEETALMHLARRVAAALAMVMALERARERANEAMARAQSAESRAESAEQERDRALARLRGVRAVRAVGTLEDTWVGYGEAMRRFEAQLRAAAQREDPIALVTEPGMAIAAVARLLHANSSRANEACVIVDAGEVHPRDALAMLVGTAAATDDDGGATPAMPGWFELVQRGTLVIVDAAALGSDAHLALIDAIGSGVARRLGGGVPYEVSARIVITARDTLAQSGLPAELCDRFAAHTLRVPALRERPEDLETLVLFAIDRACRLHARSAVGIRRDALEALRRYVWPENDRELYEALEHAVRVVRGAQITLDDLPEAVRGVRVPPGENREGDTESYDALERRILQAALDRANGNKSEAARALGLKRTTFLDKLRKYGLRL
jgi:two-component system response regulator HydG